MDLCTNTQNDYCFVVKISIFTQLPYHNLHWSNTKCKVTQTAIPTIFKYIVIMITLMSKVEYEFFSIPPEEKKWNRIRFLSEVNSIAIRSFNVRIPFWVDLFLCWGWRGDAGLGLPILNKIINRMMEKRLFLKRQFHSWPNFVLRLFQVIFKPFGKFFT